MGPHRRGRESLHPTGHGPSPAVSPKSPASSTAKVVGTCPQKASLYSPLVLEAEKLRCFIKPAPTFIQVFITFLLRQLRNAGTGVADSAPVL